MRTLCALALSALMLTACAAGPPSHLTFYAQDANGKRITYEHLPPQERFSLFVAVGLKGSADHFMFLDPEARGFYTAREGCEFGDWRISDGSVKITADKRTGKVRIEQATRGLVKAKTAQYAAPRSALPAIRTEIRRLGMLDYEQNYTRSELSAILRDEERPWVAVQIQDGDTTKSLTYTSPFPEGVSRLLVKIDEEIGPYVRDAMDGATPCEPIKVEPPK